MLNRPHPPPHLLHPVLGKLGLAGQKFIPHYFIAQTLKDLEELLQEQEERVRSLGDRNLRTSPGAMRVQFLLACFAAAASVLACLAGGASAVAIVQGLLQQLLSCSVVKLRRI